MSWHLRPTPPETTETYRGKQFEDKSDGEASNPCWNVQAGFKRVE